MGLIAASFRLYSRLKINLTLGRLIIFLRRIGGIKGQVLKLARKYPGVSKEEI